MVRGRGFAYALYVHSKFPGYGAAWSAWIADVAVNKTTGDVSVVRVVAGQDSGLMINPDGVRHQIEGNVIQSTSRALKEEVRFDQLGVATKEWGAYPIITFPEVPKIDVLMVPRPDQPPLGVGESASVPSAAAIANAIFDATGVRFREPPFTPERILAGLNGEATVQTAAVADQSLAARLAAPAGQHNPLAKRRGVLAGIAALCAAAAGVVAATLPWRAMAPIPRPDASVYATATIARGRELAAIGACAVCHTAADGAVNAGGRALETPFGVVHSTNITPDPQTGIGAWSYPAFERAMRDGIHRDGSHLYPAFPFDHFALTSDADLQALYAYLMAQPAVAAPRPANALRFPFNLRPLLAGWNALFNTTVPFTPDPAKSQAWNRGAYLVEGLGHCGACHTPRNAFGAERAGAYLAGGFAEGWEAPPLGTLSRAPIAWSEDELFTYLRTGTSRFHGVAAGPMAPVIKELSAVSDADIRAMAVYLASLNGATASGDDAAIAARLDGAATATALSGRSVGARIYQGACAVCHQGDGAHALGASRPLALNSNLHGDSPDNLIQVILHGIDHGAVGDVGAMPAFGTSLNDEQIAELAGFLRAQFAPDKPAWRNVAAAAARLRGTAH